MASGVGELFVRNGGVATRGQLKAFGYTDARLRQLIGDGVLIAKRRGTYALAKQIASVTGDVARVHAVELAAVLVGSRAACVGSHQTAAIIHGLSLLTVPKGIVNVTHPRDGAGSRTGRKGVRVHLAALPPDDIVRRHGVPVTSVARTVADLARTLTFRGAVVVADSALHQGLVTRTGLRAQLATSSRWPGSRQAKRVMAFGDERSESPLESLSRAIMHERGLPAPELQVWISDEYGARIARVDYFWPQYRTVGEADGAVKYDKSTAARDQLARDRKLRQAGYQLVHFGYQDIVYYSEATIGEFWAAFRRGQAVLGTP